MSHFGVSSEFFYLCGDVELYFFQGERHWPFQEVQLRCYHGCRQLTSISS